MSISTNEMEHLSLAQRRQYGGAKPLPAFRLGLSEKQIPLVWIPKEAIERGLEFVIPGFA